LVSDCVLAAHELADNGGAKVTFVDAPDHRAQGHVFEVTAGARRLECLELMRGHFYHRKAVSRASSLLSVTVSSMGLLRRGFIVWRGYPPRWGFAN
jgi:hypothetical protein